MTSYKNESSRRAGLERQAATVIAQVGDANRPGLERAVLLRRNRGAKASSVLAFCIAVRAFDEAVRGKSFEACSPDELARGVQHLRATRSEATVASYMIHVRSLLKDLLDRDDLPRGLRAVTAVRQPPAFREGIVFDDAAFQGILEAIQARVPENGRDHRLECLAIAWTLRDAGFRARELLALQIRSVHFHGDGTALLCLPPGAPDLKTGARDVPVKDATAPLRAWLSMHPSDGHPDAPLFCGLRSRDGLQRLGYTQLYKLVKRWGEDSGINANDPKGRTLRPHDFRHTCATMKVRRNKWQETELCQFFGWSATSKMPRHYVHLDNQSMVDRVLHDTGINEMGYRIQGDAGSKAERVLDALRTYLQET